MEIGKQGKVSNKGKLEISHGKLNDSSDKSG